MARILALTWALIVLGRYLRVDHRYLVPFLEGIGGRVFVRALWLGLAVAGLGVLLGWSGRRGPIGLLICLACLLAAWFLPGVRSFLGMAWSPLDAQVDGLRATLLIAGGGALGAGLAIGTRLGGRALSLGGLLALIVGPFLVVALAGEGGVALAGLLWLSWVARRLGKGLFLALGQRGCAQRPPALLEIAVGLCLLISSTLLLGAAGACTREGLLLFLAGTTGLLVPGIRADWAALRAFPWRRPVPLDPVQAAGGGMTVALFALLWVAALGPEVGADALGFRTAGPVQWMGSGVLSGLPEMTGSYGFCAGEVLNLLLLPLAGLPVAKVVQAGLGALVAFSAARLVAGSSGRLVLLIGFWGSTLVWWQYAWGFVDLTQLFFYFAAILALGRWLEQGGRPWLVAAGATGALATAVKLNGAGALVICLGVVVLAAVRRRTPVRTLAGDLGTLAFSGLAFMLPWLVRCFVLTGNPVFPLANGFFGSPLAPPTTPSVSFGVGLAPANLLSLPWQIVFKPHKFVELGTWHPALLALTPLGVLGLLRHRVRESLLWLGAGFLAAAAWIVTDQNGRYSLFAVLLLLVPVSQGIGRELAGLGSRLSRPLALALALFLLVGLGVQLCRPRSWLWRGKDGSALPLACVLAGQSRHDYLATVLPTYPAGNWMGRNRSEGGRVLQLTFIRDHLYFPVPATSLPHGIEPLLRPLDPVLTAFGETWDPVEAQRILLELGYTHILFNSEWPHLARFPDASWQGIFSPIFLGRFLEACHGHQGLRLYRIRDRALPEVDRPEAPDLLGEDPFEGLGLGGRFFREIPIVSAALYEIEMDLARPPAQDALFLQVSWLEECGRGLLILQKALDASATPGRYRLLQTAPLRAVRARVELFGGDAVLRGLQFRPLPALSRDPEERG